MNNPVFERARQAWENLNDRERRMLSILGLIVALMALLMPPIVLTLDNQELETQNADLRETLDHLALQHDKLAQLAEARHADDKRFRTKTPSLGSFMEAEAKKQGLTLQEVTDQPGKANGRYLRRSVTVSLPQVALSPVINLLSSITDSPYPVAIDSIQLDHFQPGDQYNVKVGVVTFDKTGAVAKAKADGASTDATDAVDGT
jgi:general secretion pathway protein M